MSESASMEELVNVDATSTDEQPRKYLRRNDDISTGVTTRSRQREQDKKTTESSESIPMEPSIADKLSSVPTIEQCAICMENLLKQEVGIPENCEHSFCLACLIEWAKKNNSCPIDRIVFRRIFKKHSIANPKPYDTMEVEDNRLQVQLEDDFLEMIDDDISCRVCGRDDQEDLLLICDECGNGYHTFCLELAGVPETQEWMCPLCEVDQLSADEDLYPDSDLEEIQHILFDDTSNTTETDTPAAVRQPRVRQTARMRTGGVRNQRATAPNTRPRRRQTQRRRRRTPARRRPTLVEQQRQRQRRQLRVHNNVNRRIENVNAITRDGSTSGATSRNATIRNDEGRLSIYDAEPIALEDEFSTTASSSSLSNRSIITPSEAARRIAASGIPILSRIETEPSISRELSIRRTTPPLDRVPSRTIRPPPLPSSQPRIPIHQLPRIQRRADASTRVRPRPRPAPPTLTRTTTDLTSSTNPSFIDNLLNSQERLHNLQNVRMHGPHIQIS